MNLCANASPLRRTLDLTGGPRDLGHSKIIWPTCQVWASRSEILAALRAKKALVSFPINSSPSELIREQGTCGDQGSERFAKARAG